MSVDDKIKVQLKCSECEYVECKVGCGVPFGLEGCVREVDLNFFVEYQSKVLENAPFIYKIKSKKGQDIAYKNVIDILYELYQKPLVFLIDEKGKIKKRFCEIWLILKLLKPQRKNCIIFFAICRKKNWKISDMLIVVMMCF